MGSAISKSYFKIQHFLIKIFLMSSSGISASINLSVLFEGNMSQRMVSRASSIQLRFSARFRVVSVSYTIGPDEVILWPGLFLLLISLVLFHQ